MQIVQKQGAEAAEMADQLQQLEGDRQQLLVVTQDLNLAEDRVCRSIPFQRTNNIVIYQLCQVALTSLF